ncbi:MAG: ROK family protein [Clostridiales bacterium]|nr:ROK family protein [Clostridiales bacterium]
MYRVGVDLGGTNIAVGLVDKNYKIISRGKVKTNLPRPAEEIFKDISKAIDQALKKANIDISQVKSIGVGTPGSVNKENGNIEFANNLNFFNVPAKKMLEEIIKKPVYLDNDANCAALGEAFAGAGKGVKSLVAVTLGTGVGSGIIIDGKIVSGVNHAAGEMGHMVIVVDGEPCNCGRCGCWEKYSSASALVSQTKSAMRKNQDSLMWKLADNSIHRVTGRTAFDAMRSGDKAGSEVVKKYVHYLAAGITNIINALQPQVLCIGGGIGNEGETLLAPLRRHVEHERYSMHAVKQTEICQAVLGNDAGIIGAALLDY